MSIVALQKNILVEAVQVNKESASGLITKVADDKYPNRGKIVSVGDKVTCVKVGDVILFKPFQGAEVKDDGKTFWAITEDDVVAKFE